MTDVDPDFDENNPEHHYVDQKDLKRVEEYLSQPIHQVDRKPFKPFYFVLLTFGSVTGLLSLAVFVTKLSGIEID